MLCYLPTYFLTDPSHWFYLMVLKPSDSSHYLLTVRNWAWARLKTNTKRPPYCPPIYQPQSTTEFPYMLNLFLLILSTISTLPGIFRPRTHDIVGVSPTAWVPCRVPWLILTFFNIGYCFVTHINCFSSLEPYFFLFVYSPCVCQEIIKQLPTYLLTAIVRISTTGQ